MSASSKTTQLSLRAAVNQFSLNGSGIDTVDTLATLALLSSFLWLRCSCGIAINTTTKIKPAIASTIKTSIIVKPDSLFFNKFLHSDL